MFKEGFSSSMRTLSRVKHWNSAVILYVSKQTLADVGLKDCHISRLYANECLDYVNVPSESVDFSWRVYLFDVGARKPDGV